MEETAVMTTNMKRNNGGGGDVLIGFSVLNIKQCIIYNPISKADVPRLTVSLFYTQYYAKRQIIIILIRPCHSLEGAAHRTDALQNTMIKITSRKKLVMKFALRFFQGCFRRSVPKFSEKRF